MKAGDPWWECDAECHGWSERKNFQRRKLWDRRRGENGAVKDKPGERQAKEKSQWRRQEAAAGGKRRAGPDGGEHQQGGDEQPGNLRLAQEAKRKGKEKT